MDIEEKATGYQFPDCVCFMENLRAIYTGMTLLNELRNLL